MKRIIFPILFLLGVFVLPVRNEADGNTAPVHSNEISFSRLEVEYTESNPGSADNPLIFSLNQSLSHTDAMTAAGELIARQLEELTGYHIVAAAPASEEDIIRAFAINNAHMAVLSAMAYVQVSQNKDATAALAQVQNGVMFYGAQFIARSDSEFTSYFDEARAANTADAAQALAQFDQRTPCWSDSDSLSGYIVPLGVLHQARVMVNPGAFADGQGPVVRAVYTREICDFGATYIDARQLPTLENNFPDVMKKVQIIWQIPPVIPYKNVSFASSLPQDMQRVLLRSLIDLMSSEEGKSAMQTLYGIEKLQPVNDGNYSEFVSFVEATGLLSDDLSD